MCDMNKSLKEKIIESPKAELHVHLRGAMPRQVLAELAKKHPPNEVWNKLGFMLRREYGKFKNIQRFVENPQNISGLFRFESFYNFLITYGFTRHFIRNIDDFRLLIRGVIDFLKAQNIVYAEVTVSLIEYIDIGFPLDDLVDCLEDEAAAAKGIRIQWIADLVRNFGSRKGFRVLRDLVRLKPKSFVGITLGGSEDYCHPKAYAKHFKMAREAGFSTTVHAGEAMGPESVWRSLKSLKPDRIGHGIRSVEDESLLKHLAEKKISLEVCPTSNVFLGVYPSYEQVPIRRLCNAGARVTINSDDPAFFGASLNDELSRLPELGFSEEDVLDFIEEGFMSAFISDEEKTRYISTVQEEWGKN